MGQKRVRDLSDASRHGIEVVAECGRCGNVRVLDPWTLDQLYRKKGWSRSIERIGERLRCSRCKPSVKVTFRLRDLPPRRRPQDDEVT